MTTIWEHCVDVDGEVAASTGCFTTLPIRIHRRNDIADDATKQSIHDWGAYVGDGWEQRSGSSWSPVGNWGAFIFPESLPDRLGVITYLANMGNIHDDLCDELPFEEALKEHSNLSQAMEVSNSDTRQCSKASDRSMKMKKYISKCLLEAMEIDRARALRMINSYRSKWLDVMESQNVNDMQTLEEYLAFRNLNGGMEAFWSMVEFGMAIDISESEKTHTRPLFQAAESALVLTNDYWSWDREWRLAQRTQDPRIVNAVHLFMRTEGLSVDQAREKVRERIVDYEREYLRLKEEFYTQNPNLPLYLRRYVEVCGVITAGNHYWCANCPRHHAWRDEESSPSERSFSPSNEGIEDPRLSPGASTTSSMSQKSSPATEITLSDVLGFMAINDNHKPQRSSDMALMAPVQYIRSMPSKGLRSLMVEALDQWLLVDDPELEQIKNIIDLLHNSSLILDDIEDDSPLRRGLPATHTVFGQAQSINSANFMFVQAVQMTQKLNNPASLDTLLDELECLFIGQSWDLYWKFHLQVPTEKEYLEMVDCKTGAMFRLLARLMFHESSVVSGTQVLQLLDEMCRLFGRFFQIRDDFMNLYSTEYSDQKGFCEDLDEGKMSYPLIMLLWQNPGQRDQIMGIFRQQASNTSRGPTSDRSRLPLETKRYVMSLLKGSDIMASTLRKLRDLEAAVDYSISGLEKALGDANPVMRIVLSRLSVRDVSL
ncbi:Ophiobolin F synthase [Colletotrichum orbiculare MAFF 240422]|uniref:Sesterterpene synthase btcA n=2 Tax=Colletotrichum orbiculare TaxID=5465 RepID=BTCA_COLOR|nr:RecName: Full=Sesterterpene synthase btcA; Short=TS; AltName: Full=Betaestacins biosynthesis cluster protein A; Includes: RecName: Full=Terpene cyclase; Includes: RecName: Full=Geranylgeranyl diphosphate synthase; Short=GGDP synthase; Short=GGS; Includes: RecName: Full=Geranylfarnesyl diphosphate synthase; Short=GFDP synthase [Colletotrichum orbiculare MAFF 240422]QXF69086.1 fusaproliferene [Colletotrichum orbiculare]TDZ21940.1 Ophiobolin F synthase [Colletotrichum orbiculare MAFF 240422]